MMSNDVKTQSADGAGQPRLPRRDEFSHMTGSLRSAVSVFFSLPFLKVWMEFSRAVRFPSAPSGEDGEDGWGGQEDEASRGGAGGGSDWAPA